MKKSILLAIISLGNLVSAQQTPNNQLNQKLENKKMKHRLNMIYTFITTLLFRAIVQILPKKI